MSRKLFQVVLPARFGSTRFPGKPLAKIAGKPLIEWVYRRATEIRNVDELVVATDDRRIADAVKAFGGNVVRTSGDHVTGTDRVAEVARSSKCDYVANLQGDEPIFDPRTVEEMVELLDASPDTGIVTACHPIETPEDYVNPNIVKVTFDRDGRALYFSRSPIPSNVFNEPVARQTPAPGTTSAVAYRHVGVYIYRRDTLLQFASLKPTALERSERLEQLRALENGITMRVIVSAGLTLGVDVPGDVIKVEKELIRLYTDLDKAED